MKRFATKAWTPLLAVAALMAAAPAAAQIGGMTCIECHADPGSGGFHGGFRGLSDLTDDQVDAVCMSCHDGSYRNPQGVDAPEAMVHQNKNPGEGRDEYGDFKASCRDCHTNHSPLLAGDGSSNPNLRMLGPRVEEASSTDGIARIRKPVIDDVLGNNGGSANNRYEDDLHIGWECDSGVKDDPTCIETDPPDPGDGVRKLVFYLDIDTASTNWAQTAPPYNGACNTCHTRTSHHRRDDSGGDHTHNITKAGCVACHSHSSGWLNKGG